MYGSRKNRGSNNGGASLTEAEVRAIRQALQAGATQGTLARLYQVGVNTIGRIARGETWNWLDIGSSSGSSSEQPAGPVGQPQATEEAMQRLAEESLRKLQAMGAGQTASGSGEARLKREAEPAQRADEQLKELQKGKP